MLIGRLYSPVTTPMRSGSIFAGQALLILDTLAPAKRFKVCNPTAPPISEATKDLIAQRRAYLHNGDRDRYKTLNRLVRAAIREDTRLDLRRRIQDSGRGDIWRCIRPLSLANKRPDRYRVLMWRQ